MTFNDNAQLDTSQASGGGGGGMRPGGIAVGGGAGGVLLMIVFIVMQLLGGGGGGGAGLPVPGGNAFDPSHVSAQGSADADFSQCKTGADANRDDACRVIGTTNAVQGYWSGALGSKYRQIKTVIFSGAVSTGCGNASAETGPFYCPMDERVYIDVSFYRELQQRFGASAGALAKSYVIAHEYGHHVQNIAGVLGRAQQDPKGPESGAVRVELQADCYAGVWMAHADEAKDANGTSLFIKPTAEQLKDAQNAASVIGDDKIQETVQGRVSPENFTHGSSAQRQKWLMHGYETGDPAQCNTFEASDLG